MTLRRDSSFIEKYKLTLVTMHSSLDRVRGKAAGLERLAITMALPHENKAQRLPAIPATWTATCEFMSDGSMAVPDNTAARAALCRDPAYPLWRDKICRDVSGVVIADQQWTLPTSPAYAALGLPDWARISGSRGATPTIDGITVTDAEVADEFVVGQDSGRLGFYIPPTMLFTLQVYTANSQVGVTLVADLEYFILGEWRACTVALAGYANGFRFTAVPGSKAAAVFGQLLDGFTPTGFVNLKSLRVGSAAVTTACLQPELLMGWTVADFQAGVEGPTGTKTAFFPAFPPAEWATSNLPYVRTRATATAALFTNVTAVLAKEGTVLAARVKQSVTEFHSFNANDINSVHPRFRYFGPLEKGLYTFTTPSSQDSDFADCQYPLPCYLTGTRFAAFRPLFQFGKVGVYNAIIFTDMATNSVGTNLAVSLYTHLEFETVSSLFTPGVSTYTLEQLHAAEVALLSFGHFHENPAHWAAIRAAAVAALRVVGPMVAPIVARVGQNLLDRGVKYLTGNKPAGDRRMVQAAPLTTPKRNKKPGKKPKAKPPARAVVKRH